MWNLSEEERCELNRGSARRQALRPQAQASPDPARRRCRGERRDDRDQHRRRRLDRLPHQAAFRGRRPGSGAERDPAAGRRAQAHRQGGSSPGRYRLFEPAAGRARWTLELLAGEMVSSPNMTACRARRSAGAQRERPQALAEEDVVHPQARRRLCRPHGGCARPLRRGPRPDAAGGLLRRKPDPAHRRGPPAHPRGAAPARALSTTSIAATAPPISSSSSMRIGPGGTSRSPSAAPRDDFALGMRDLVDLHFPKAEKIRVVLDNLSTHTAAALYAAFPPDEARRLCAGSSSTTPQSMPAGSTWSRSRSACSSGSASTAASTTIDASPPKSPPGSASAIHTALASTGCSQPKRPAPKWPGPIRDPPQT